MANSPHQRGLRDRMPASSYFAVGSESHHIIGQAQGRKTAAVIRAEFALDMLLGFANMGLANMFAKRFVTRFTLERERLRRQHHGNQTRIHCRVAPFAARMSVQNAPLRVPKAGDTIRPDTLGTRELLFFKHLVRQEHPSAAVRLRLELRVDGRPANDIEFLTLGDARTLGSPISIDQLNRLGTLDSIDHWPELARALEQLTAVAESAFPGRPVELEPFVTLGGEPIAVYVVRHDAYFMLGDNRDNSLDSRYWGFVSRKFVKAQALIIYFSLDSERPLWQFPWNIRWERIGKLIRGWDGESTDCGGSVG